MMALALAICLHTNLAESQTTQTSVTSTHNYTIYDTHGTIMPDTYTGQGKKVYANGDETVGNFKNGLEEDFGVYTTKDGEKYVGNFTHGLKNGFGLYTWPNGDEYAGNFKNGRRNGYGKITWADGKVYEGDWSNGARTGRGTFKWPEGDKYEGDFKNGYRDGFGTYTWKNGNKFTGQWSDGNRNGEGTLFYADGTTKTGTWKKDEYVAPAAQSSASTSASSAQTADDVDYYTAQVTADLNLRKGPGTDYDIVTTIPRGERVFLTSADANEPFRYVMYIDKSEFGYVDSNFLSNIKKVEIDESGNLNIERKNHKTTADITLENETDRVITVLFGKARYKLNPKQVRTIKDVKPGKYKIVASSPGVEPYIVSDTVKSGYEYSWHFYIYTELIEK